MKKVDRGALSPREMQVWTSTYGAAFAEKRLNTKRSADAGDADHAATIADTAVQLLRLVEAETW